MSFVFSSFFASKSYVGKAKDRNKEIYFPEKKGLHIKL